MEMHPQERSGKRGGSRNEARRRFLNYLLSLRARILVEPYFEALSIGDVENKSDERELENQEREKLLSSHWKCFTVSLISW